MPLVDLSQHGAKMSDDRVYRYALWRRQMKTGLVDLMVGLNPSTADAELDDNTSRRFQFFSKRDGYALSVMVNLYGLRSTSPKKLLHHDDPVGRENDNWIEWFAMRADRIILGWGSHTAVKLRGREARVLRILHEAASHRGIELGVFGRNHDGRPQHPLYLSNTTEVQPWIPF